MKYFYILSVFFSLLFSPAGQSQCSLPPLDYSVAPVGCWGGGVMYFNNLPEGNWTLYVSGSTDAFQIQDSGSYYMLTNLANDFYVVTASDEEGCVSPTIYTSTSSGIDWEANVTGVYVDSNANGFTDLGDVIDYTLTITNPFSCEIGDVFAHGLGLNGTIIPPIAANTAMTYNFSMPLTQAHINIGHVFGPLHLSASYAGGPLSIDIPSDTVLTTLDCIRLNAFLDYNGNGTRESNEPPFTDGSFQVINDNDGIVHHYGASLVQPTIYELNPTTTYDISFTFSPNNACIGSYTCNASYDDITVPTFSGMTVYDFPITATPCTDVGVVLNCSRAVPGFIYTNTIIYKNYGTQNAFSGSITYTKPPQTTIVSVSPSGAVMTPTGFTFDYTNLSPTEQRNIFIELQVPTIPTVALGEELFSVASTTFPAEDLNATNNSAAIKRIIVGSMDPNDKTEVHEGSIVFADFTSDDYLTYTINFENTGTAEAFKVVITDELEAGLDVETFRMIQSSHPCLYEREANHLEFTFRGINLEPDGKGFVTFQIKPAAGYAIGDTIENTASIYFDFNPAIVTNTVQTTFVPELGAPQINDVALTVYPNPVKSVLYLGDGRHSSNIGHVTITDVSGKSVLVQAINDPQAAVDVSRLANGIYFIRAQMENNTLKVAKFIKE